MALPNFLIIGAGRSGTTTLYHGLIQHPSVFMPVHKEPHFFSQKWDLGRSWYESLFAESGDATAIGEASVSYTYPEPAETPDRIASVLGQPRLIYMLRNPIERTWSHYLYYRDYGLKESLAFEKAIAQNPLYLEASNYERWIEVYRQKFGHDNLHVIVLEEFSKNPAPVFREVFRFLGVDEEFTPERGGEKTNSRFKAKNDAVYKVYHKLSRSKLRRRVESLIPAEMRPVVRNTIRNLLGKKETGEVMDPQVRTRLEDHFAPMIGRLERSIDRDLGIWKKTRSN